MPQIRLHGPKERLTHPPTGLRLGRDFTSPVAHIWISTGGSPEQTRKLSAYTPETVSESELSALQGAGILFDVIEEGV